jgi:sterol desaturase/sphingolipid hydroxylase (fatty acid hydroxylase superfamily)
MERLDLVAIAVVLLTWANLVLGTFLAYRQERRAAPERAARGFLAYAFPREIIFHRSSLRDYLFIVVHKLTYPVLIAPAIAAIVALGHWSAAFAEARLGVAPPLEGATWWASLAFSVLGLTVAADFGDFWTHRLMHRVWWLWEIHKVHHSAEVMALGATGRRNHPIEDILRLGMSVALSGIVCGIFAYGFGLSVEEVTFFGIDIFLVLKLLGFYHLKHGHAPLHFPRRLERLIVSPAQHQLHHSRDPRHHGSNFGTLISCWDIAYGTWHASRLGGSYTFGLEDDEHREYDSIAKLYYLPFLKIARELKRRRAAQRPCPSLAA